MAKRKRAPSRKARAKATGPALHRINGVEIVRRGVDQGTAERQQHGHLATVDTYAAGQRGRALRDQDTIARLLANKTITVGAATAARQFQRLFHVAGLGGLRAVQLERQPAGPAGEGLAQVQARRRVVQAIDALGGHQALGGSAVWYVVGVGDSVKDWAQRQRLGHGRDLNERTAVGILIGALGALEAHLRIGA